ERKLDIVIISAGSLLGSDLYHAIRVVSNVLGAVRKGGTVILVAECSRGIGDSSFLEYARRFPERKELSTELRYRFKLGGHVNLFLQDALEKCRVQLVSILPVHSQSPQLITQQGYGLNRSASLTIKIVFLGITPAELNSTYLKSSVSVPPLKYQAILAGPLNTGVIFNFDYQLTFADNSTV